jgi:hypothetical protein
MSVTPLQAPAARVRPGTLRLGRFPVVLPRRGDPRLRVAGVIVSLQVLGQVALGFKVSVAQILVTIGACAVLELGITFYRQRALIWPASAILTGNGVSFVLRASGTRHGDWWTLHGIQYFLLAGCVGLLSKYVLTRGSTHYFNPSNIGLVACLLVVGAAHVFPQYLWWGPLQPPVIAALAVIVGGVVWVLRPVGMLPMAVSFLLPFWALTAVFAATGQCFLATWHAGPVCGASYWLNIGASPELLIFVFYMMSDPRTAARAGRPRLVYGALTAIVAAILIHPQATEFGIKVALLVALTVVCSVVPLVERVPRPVRLRPTPVTVAVILIAVASSLATLSLRHDRGLLDLERGIIHTGGPAAQ